MAEELAEPFPNTPLLGYEPDVEAAVPELKPKKQFDRAIVEGPLTKRCLEDRVAGCSH